MKIARRRGARVCARLILPIVLVAAYAAQPTPAHADDLGEGVRLYHEGEFEQASARLERAARALPAGGARARARLFRGLAQAVLAQWDGARDDFSAALRDDPDVDLDRDATKPSVVALFDGVRKRLVGSLACATDRAATVFVDGAAKGPAPLRKRLLAGTYVVRAVSDDGFADATQEAVTVRGGETTTLSLRLALRTGKVSVSTKPAGAAVLLRGRRIATTPVTGLLLPAGRHTLDLLLEGHTRARVLVLVNPALPAELSLQLTRKDDRPWYRKKRVFAFISAGAAAALVGGGAIAGVLARASESEIASRGREGTLDYDRLRSLSDSASSRARAANVLFAISGAAAVTSLVLFLLRDGPPADSVATSETLRAPGLAITPLGIVWHQRF